MRRHATDALGTHPGLEQELSVPIADVRPVPLTTPLVEHSVGLIAVDRDPVSPLVLAAFECADGVLPPEMALPSSRAKAATL